MLWSVGPDTYLNVLYFINDTSFFDSFDERIARAIVRDRQAKCIFRLDDLDFLWSAFSMCKDEIV